MSKSHETTFRKRRHTCSQQAYEKKAQYHWSLEKYIPKPQWDTISHRSEWLLLKSQKITDVGEDVKDLFADSKESAANVASFKIDEVELRSLYYYSSDEEISVSYKVNYTYKLTDSDSEKSNYSLVRVTYDLSNLEVPKDLSYMPY